MARRRLPKEPQHAEVDALADDGRGIARLEGKVVFIDGALPGESVRFRYVKRRRSYDEGHVVEVLRPAADRVAPRCRFFELCGGCRLQHLDPQRQILVKQDWLLENLRRVGEVEPAAVLAPLHGPHWGYRRKARLAVKDVPGKGGVLVGFREKHSPYVAQIARCEVLHPSVGERLEALAELVGGLSVRRRVPQIEVAVGDNATALVFRHLDPLTEDDRRRLIEFGERTGVHVWAQPRGPETAHPLWPGETELYYRLDAQGIDIAFKPVEFTQVNAEINAQMVERALGLLDPSPDERVLDLFCGLGNFSLPLARHAACVQGVEGDATLVERARANARRNGIGNAAFACADLASEVIADARWLAQPWDKVLLDPARPGAEAVVRQLPRVGARRIVYVSCHPATLARDAGILVHEQGLRLRAAGVMDMFPHTAHVESIALFER